MADIVLKPVDGVLYKTIKPYMIENLAAFSKQSRSHAADSNTAAKICMPVWAMVLYNARKAAKYWKKEQLYKIKHLSDFVRKNNRQATHPF